MKEQPETKSEHEGFMAKCLALARVAKQQGESPVGAILVKDGFVAGSGIEASKAHLDITFHAEIEAIRQATALLQTQDLSGYTLYTTHEPCIMCAYVIRHTKISTVIIGITTGEMGGVSSAYPLMLDNTIEKWKPAPEVITGILEKECWALHG